MDFVATSFYSSATRDENSKYPGNETCYAFSSKQNAETVENFIIQTFIQGSVILKAL